MSVEIKQVLNDDVLVHSELVSENIKFLRVQYYKKTNILNVRVKSSNLLDTNKNNLLKDIISKRLGSFKNINLLCCRYINDVKPEDIITSYWDSIVDSVGAVVPVCKECLNKSKRSFESGQISVNTGNEFVAGILTTKGIEKIIREVILDYFDIDIPVRFQFNPELKEENSLLNKEIKVTNIKPIDEVCITKNNKEKISSNHKQERAEVKSNVSNVIVGKHFSDLKLDIKDIDEPLGIVAIEGDIFKVDIIKTKNDKTIMCFYITDYTSSIQVKFFPKPKELERVLSEIKEGIHCSVRGNAQNDIYSKEITILARDIVKSLRFEKEDNATEKRVELHLHTQMSSMDGMTSVSKLIERAAKWGHSAIAITDHGVLQAFPEAMGASKKYNIKVIYGVEAYLVDDEVPIASISEDKSLEDTYVIFDLETTGLSPKLDRIIEIGAVKISKGLVIDRFSTFVNPGIKIPDKIIELTSINDSLVKDAKGIDEILPVFLQFTKGCILVAHNAEFDVSFLKNKCQDFNIPFDYSYMDTILLCKFLYPELKKYKLDVVAHHLGIDLKSHHRAIDDAKATCDILLNCFSKLKELNIDSLSQLNKKYLETIDMKKLPTNHLIILVKNQVGLKNLYKLISKSNLDYFYKKPRMPKSEINRLREGLIIGSACEAGQIYRNILAGKSDDELTSLISFYDYLEIQPLGNNDFLIRNGTVKDKDSLKDINFRIINLGKKNNLPVVATCDVHFLDPRDSVFRKILMFGQGFSDAEEQAPLYLRTTDEMLQEFSYLGDALAKEVVITNPQKILEIVGDVLPIPNETFPPKIEGAEEDIRKMTTDRAHEIYGEILPEVVQKRLDKELNSIINHGYAVLYLIAQKLVSKSLEDGYLVGSRGSVGSSFAATMSNITEVNGLPPHYVCPKCKNSEFILDGSVSSGADLPDKECPSCGAKYRKDGDDIPFETFLGFEGDKEPDIDLNFSGEYQAVVHKYTEVLFGKGFVFKAGTIGTVAEKTAYGYVQKYLNAKGIIVPKAEIERLTKGCTGIKRTTGQHPGGIMVVPRDNEIYNFTPIQHPADDKDTDIVTTHFDYHSISGRLLKLDILGHDDPTMLRMLQDLTGVDPKSIPLGDENVMSLFESPEALGVTADDLGCEVGTYGLPEFGTKFVRQMLLDTNPKTFADLVRISGLSHGTDVWLNNAQYFIKTGKTTLKDCISTRDDIMIYLLHQEVAPKTAFTIMEKVRKGKGLNEDDIETMKKKNVPDWYIESCQKIKYMFPKGHAVAYVMSAVRIAYYKVYYPLAYYTSYFTVRADDFDTELIFKGEEAIKRKMNELNSLGNNITQKDKGLLTILEISYEMFKRNIKLLKVDLYKSHATKFQIVEGGILPPLRALVGVGENAAKSIAQVRKNGEFLSKEDLRIRAKVTKTVIETLSKHGCLDGITETNQLTLF